MKKTDKNTKKRKIPLSFLLKVGFYLFLLGSISFGYIVYKLSEDLPDYKQLSEYTPSITSRFYASDGSLLTEYAKERRTFVHYEQFPEKLVSAFIATEDQNFWKHKGIDPKGIIRSIFINVKNKALGAHRKLVGASTITQQVSRNFFLSSDQKYERKIKEIILALKIERTYSKQHIMTLYLNQIFLGARSYGVAAAAKSYFNKGLDELTLPEMAFLAGLPKAPSNYHPVRNKEKALDRRNFVLKRMREEGYISRSEYEDAVQADLDVADSLVNKQEQYSKYFAEEIRKVLTDEYGTETFYRGGLSVLTTADPVMQETATKLLKKALLNYDNSHGYRGAVRKFDMSEIKRLVSNGDVETLKKEFGENLTEKLILNSKKVDTAKKDIWEILVKYDSSLSGMYNWEKAIITSVASDIITLGLESGKTGLINLKPISNFRVDPKVYGVTKVSLKDNSWKKRIFDEGDIIFVEKKAGTKNYYDLRQSPKINGGMVAMDPKTGRVFAMVGGFSFNKSFFNRVTQSRRQPGSTIKPFVYMAGLDSEKYVPNSTLLDAPVVISKGDGAMWKPENYDNKFLGEIPMYLSLWKSRNNPTVRLAKDVGIRNVIKMSEKFGVYNHLSSKEKNLSLALGSGATTLLNLTTAYSQILNGGRKITPTMIDKVQDREGNNIYVVDKRNCEECGNIDWQNGLLPPTVEDNRAQIIDERTAYQITHMMKGVVDYGSGKKAKIPGRDIAGKTGTSNDAKDVWFVGGTPDLVVGIYMGFDQPESLGWGSAGGTLCAPIFKEFMTTILSDSKATTFPVPTGIKFVRLDKATGKPAAYDLPESQVVVQPFKLEDNVEKVISSEEGGEYQEGSEENNYAPNDSEDLNLEEDIY
ncbi:MAG: PBP1A family penicillin-binding protein [Alphaproteobacteria bacterium]|jgi:penicillin-binding protein 1A|nr:PBP1A family penicillin-binding protein [Alphaproteobacteria bacterium]